MSVPALLEFLRRELAPMHGRGRATLCLTIACLTATIPIFTHRIPHGLIVMIVMYLVTQEDFAATLIGSVLGLAGVTISLSAALLAWEICLDIPWLRICFFAMFLLGGLFLKRVIAIPGLGSALGIPAPLAMVLPDIYPAGPEHLVYFVLWVWVCAAVGLSVNVAVQLLLSRGDPLTLLRGEMDTRLRAVARALFSLAGGKAKEPEPVGALLRSLAVAGMSRPLSLLRSSTLLQPWVRERHDGIAAIVTLVDRLVTDALALETLATNSSVEVYRERLLRVADSCERTRQAFEELRLPAFGEPLALGNEQNTEAASLLNDMEQKLDQIALALPSYFENLRNAPTAERRRFFLPDAFDNPEYVHFAIRGALAAMICYICFVGLEYPGIYTSVITCFVVSVSSVKASNQKGILRFGGAAVGGGMGLIALVYLLPNAETIGGFWLIFGAGTAVAAWINFGSCRISYGGYQTGLAFYKSVFQEFGPPMYATVIRDRLVGIFFGLIVFGIVEHYLWPVSARDRIRERLADALHSLRDLALACSETETASGEEVEALRNLISQQVADLQGFMEGSKFEPPGPDSPSEIGKLTADVQSIFLVLLAIARHQKEMTELPEYIRESVTRLDTATATALMALADAIQGKVAALSIDVGETIASFENLVSALLDLGRDAGGACLECLALYRQLAIAVSRLLQSASTKTAGITSPLLSIPDPA